MAVRGSVLIVDHEIGTRESLRIILKSENDIYEASNGPEAIRLLQDKNIHLVTLELRMPGRSGLDILKEMKKLKPDVEVLIITGYITRKNIQEAIRDGASHFICKPFDVTELIDIVRKSFDQKKSLEATENLCPGIYRKVANT